MEDFENPLEDAPEIYVSDTSKIYFKKLYHQEDLNGHNMGVFVSSTKELFVNWFFYKLYQLGNKKDKQVLLSGLKYFQVDLYEDISSMIEEMD